MHFSHLKYNEASGDCTSDLNKINPFDMDQVYSNEEFYLRNLQDLIWSYQKKSKCKKRVCFWILFMMILFCVGYTLLIYYDRIRLSTFYAFDLWSLILIGVLSFVLFAILLNHRFEMNAIEWILLELQIKIGPRKNLLEDE